MYERIVEIIVYVISELKSNRQISDIDIDELQKQGYSKTEISTAFSWIVDRFELADKFYINQDFVSQDSFRILHEAERDLFTKEAWGELLQMLTLGLLTNDHIELIIERTIMTGMNQINSDMLKLYVANIIFNAQINNFPGNRLMLTGEDLIN
jgi:uncharacterized protein Smg (DUF494 family)